MTMIIKRTLKRERRTGKLPLWHERSCFPCLPGGKIAPINPVFRHQNVADSDARGGSVAECVQWEHRPGIVSHVLLGKGRGLKRACCAVCRATSGWRTVVGKLWGLTGVERRWSSSEGEAGEQEVFQMADANQCASCCSVVPSVCAREVGRGRQSSGPRGCRVCLVQCDGRGANKWLLFVSRPVQLQLVLHVFTSFK